MHILQQVVNLDFKMNVLLLTTYLYPKESHQMKRGTIFWLLVIIGVVAYIGYNPNELSGVVQSSKFVPTANGVPAAYVLTLGTSEDSDYIAVQIDVLVLQPQNVLTMAGSPGNFQMAEFLSLGDSYIGKKIRVRGEIQRDSQQRKSIWVTKKEQIEYI